MDRPRTRQRAQGTDWLFQGVPSAHLLGGAALRVNTGQAECPFNPPWRSKRRQTGVNAAAGLISNLRVVTASSGWIWFDGRERAKFRILIVSVWNKWPLINGTALILILQSTSAHWNCFNIYLAINIHICLDVCSRGQKRLTPPPSLFIWPNSLIYYLNYWGSLASSACALVVQTDKTCK